MDFSSFDLSSLPSSTAGILGAVALVLLGLVARWMKRRDDRNEDLERQIAETEEALRTALENGMVTDAQRLNKQLQRLRKKLGARMAAASVVLLCLLTGCGSIHGKKVEYVVVGERINLVEPGQVITVPELKPPAKQWYMVDNVGLEGWLGIGGSSRGSESGGQQ